MASDSDKVSYKTSRGAKQTCPQIKRGTELLYLSRQEIDDLGFTSRELLTLVRGALREHGRHRCQMPVKVGLRPVKDAIMHAMPAFVPCAGACGVKWVNCFPDNQRYKVPQTSALLTLNDIQTGWPVAIMDATWITAKRTPMVTAVAVQKLARRDSEEVGILGCGVQGREHIAALVLTMPRLKRVKVLDKSPTVAARLVRDTRRQADFEIVRATDIEQLVRGSDVVVTATTILQKPNPLIKDKWIKRGALLAPIDLHAVWKRKTMKRCDKFLVDSVKDVESFLAAADPAQRLPKVYGELGEVVAGLKPGRESDDERIMTMNIGMGVVDVVLGRAILDRAIKQGIGTRLPL